mmetsp:Transcript_21966/g.53153  ORF Transcript_21966/g.53153 Transcript_21966/m.53153 type:complete len:289 (-) Transcript_21966:37-903(-)
MSSSFFPNRYPAKAPKDVAPDNDGIANFDALSLSLPDAFNDVFNSFMVTLQTENFSYLRTSKPSLSTADSTSYFGDSRSGVLSSISSEVITFPSLASFWAIDKRDETPLNSGFAMLRSRMYNERRALLFLDSSSSFSSGEEAGVDNCSNFLNRSCLARREYLANGNLVHHGRLFLSGGIMLPKYCSILSVPRTSARICTAVDAAVEFPFSISSINEEGAWSNFTSAFAIKQHDGDDDLRGYDFLGAILTKAKDVHLALRQNAASMDGIFERMSNDEYDYDDVMKEGDL